MTTSIIEMHIMIYLGVWFVFDACHWSRTEIFHRCEILSPLSSDQFFSSSSVVAISTDLPIRVHLPPWHIYRIDIIEHQWGIGLNHFIGFIGLRLSNEKIWTFNSLKTIQQKRIHNRYRHWHRTKINDNYDVIIIASCDCFNVKGSKWSSETLDGGKWRIQIYRVSSSLQFNLSCV